MGMFHQILRDIVPKMEIIGWRHKTALSGLHPNYLHGQETFVEVCDRVSSMSYQQTFKNGSIKIKGG